MNNFEFGFLHHHTRSWFAALALLLSGLGIGANDIVADEAPRLVDIGGRKLLIQIRGTGNPAVVIEAGMGEPAVDSGGWNRVVEDIAKSNRVVLYNRAGLGSSHPDPKLPRTSLEVATDLKRLLANAGLAGPYVLVGHSYGGLHARVFASEFPEMVAGMVLVDASHPDQDQRWLASFGPESPEELESVRRIRRFLASRTTAASNPEQIDPKANSILIGKIRGLGDKPLVILTHSAGFKIDPDLPDEKLRQIETVWTGIQNEFKGISTRSVLLQSRNGGHNLHGEDPELVISGIRRVLSQLKGSAEPARSSAPAAGR